MAPHFRHPKRFFFLLTALGLSWTMAWAQVPQQSACQGEPLRFETAVYESKGRIIGWNWDFGDPASGLANQSRQENPSHIYHQPGDYLAMLILRTARGVTDTLTTPVKVHPRPGVALDRISACSDSVLSLALTDSTQGVQATWCWGDGSPPDDGAVATHHYAQHGAYPLHLVVANRWGCVTERMDTLRWPLVPPAPEVWSDTICAGRSTKLFARDVNAGRLRWYYPPDGAVPLAEADTLQIPSLETSTRYAVARYDTLTGCAGTRTLVEVPVLSPPKARIVHHYETPDRIPAQLSFAIEPAKGLHSYHWNFGDGKDGHEATPEHLYQQPGSYVVSSKVKNAEGCVWEFTTQIEVTAAPPVAYPSSFSPNGDGVNDYFRLELVNLRDLKIQILDSKGQVVFQATDPDFQWDGYTLEGTPVSAGIYTCIIQGHDPSGRSFKQQDTITLIR